MTVRDAIGVRTNNIGIIGSFSGAAVRRAIRSALVAIPARPASADAGAPALPRPPKQRMIGTLSFSKPLLEPWSPASHLHVFQQDDGLAHRQIAAGETPRSTRDNATSFRPAKIFV